MKYFTKEWYNLMQKTSLHLLLEEAKKAEHFSEEYFQWLYNEKLTEFLDLWKEVANISQEPFDSEKLSKQFKESFIYNQEHIKDILPEKILNQIADIRVYLLDKASRQVIKEVTQFCEHNKSLVERTMEEYNNYCKEAENSFDTNMVKNIYFHDCKVTDIRQGEQSLTMFLNNSGGFTDVDEVTFENYNILKQDASLENLWWLYEEIYKSNDKYELHALLQSKNMDLVDFIISFEHIKFKHKQDN